MRCEFQRQKFRHISPFHFLITKQTQQIRQRDLGVLIENIFFSPRYISSVYSACFYHIRDIRRISKGLPLTLAKRIVVALVTGKLDYCNSLLHNIPGKDMSLKNDNLSKIIWLG